MKKKKMKFKTLKCLSVLLTLCLLFTVLCSAPLTVSAETTETPTGVTILDVNMPEEEEEVLPGEAISVDGSGEVERTPVRRLYEEEGDDLNKTIWLNDDGTRTMTIYDYPVKFVNDEGEIQDISLDVAAATDGTGTYKTTAGWVDTVFPKKITDGVTLSGEGETLRLTPVMPQTALMSNTDRIVASDNVSLIDTQTGSYNYDDKTTIEYSLTYNGFKEDIVVSEYTGQTEYSFYLETGGLTLVNENGSYVLKDAEGNTKASIGDVIIFTADERNNTMGSMSHVTVKENHSYFITIHVDADWLSDEETVYPIRIDPSLEMTSAEKLVEDVTIHQRGGTNPTSVALYIGNREDLGASRVLMKFPNLNLSGIDSASNIISAGIRIRDLYCQDEAMGVYAYIYDGNDWEDTTASWGNNANGSTHFMSHNNVSYANGVSKSHKYYFSITPAVKYWKLTAAEKANRPDNYDFDKGIMLKATKDTTMAYQYKAFGSYNNATHRPTIEIVYNNEEDTISKPFGWFDKVTDTEISGWAWCFDYPLKNLSFSANLYNESTGEYVAILKDFTVANRPDVEAAGYGNGNYGFRIPIDWSDYPPGLYRVRAYVHNLDGKVYEMVQSPRYYDNNTDIKFSAESLELVVGERYQLMISVCPPDVNIDDIVWKVNDGAIEVTVNQSGIVTAVNGGTAWVYACAGDYVATCEIKVLRNYVTREEPLIVGISTDDYEMGLCEYGERAGYRTGTAFWTTLKESSVFDSTLLFHNNTKYQNFDKLSTKNDFLPKSLYGITESNVEDVELMLFVGHGTTDSGLHFSFGPNGYEHHTNPNNHALPELNCSISEVKFGYISAKTKWIAMYTCNFLSHDVNELKQMMCGANIVLGYSSKAYLVDEQMSLFAKNLSNNQTIIEAWFNSSTKHTQYSTMDATMAAVFVEDAVNDTINYYLGDTGAHTSEVIRMSYHSAPGKEI